MLEIIKLLSLRIRGFFANGISIATAKQKLEQHFRISLYSNAFYLMVTNAVATLFGFIFWIMVAKLYPAETVGLASAVIAAMGLLANFANLGFGHGLIRFLPNAGKKSNNLLNSSFTISILASLIVSLIFLSGLHFWSPVLVFLRQKVALVIVFVVFTEAFTIQSVADGAVIASRRTGFLLAREIIFDLLRLPLVVLLAGVAYSFGIFGSWGISLCAALLFNIILFLPRLWTGYRPALAIGREVNQILHFAFVSYISNFLWIAPGLILPIIIINRLGAEPAAYFSIAWAINSGLTGTVVHSISVSLFAEGSHDEQTLRISVRRSIRMMLLILVPVVILLVAFADKALLVFGNAYSERATTLLRTLILSTLPMSINTVYIFTKRVEKKMTIVIIVTAFLAVSTLAISYALLPGMGVTGIGVSWLISHGIVAFAIMAGFIIKRKRASSSI